MICQSNTSEVEEWRDVQGYEGLYLISNLGQVQSLGRVRSQRNVYTEITRVYTGKILSQRIGKAGYQYVNLYSLDKRTTKKIHRLVAEAFLENPENKPQVNHIDGNKLNNTVTNLEWNTSKENIVHGYNIGLIPRCPFGVNSANYKGPVHAINAKGELEFSMHGSQDFINKGFTVDGVKDVLRGRSKSHRGYIFTREILNDPVSPASL